jgi:streptogramin lyase
MRITLGALSLVSVVVLSGCIGTRIGSNMQINPLQGASLQGSVHGGENPVVGAKVYLYATNTTGYGSASISLLDSPGYVTTDSNGNFSITGDYTCPNANSQVYLYAVGGNPGLAQGTNNPAAGMLAGLGSCGSLKSSTVVIVNEVSTIATAYAIAGYAVDATHVSSSGSALALTGIANAFAAIPNLEQVTTTGSGTSFLGIANTKTPAGNGTVPQAEINTLANILAACTNSTGAVTGPTNATPCYTLFTNAESGGATGTQPTDTATAAINIAHNPGLTNLLGLQPASPPFQPVTGSLHDFTISVNYSGGALDWPYGITVDGDGNIWVTNYSGNNVSKFSPIGAPLSGPSGFSGGGLLFANGIAIDASGNAWVPSSASGQVARITEFSSLGSVLSGASGYTGSDILAPSSIAFDASGNAWVTNYSFLDNISEFNSAGTPISGSTGYTGGGLDEPIAVAIDTSGDAWIANGYSYGGITEFSPSGTVLSCTGSCPVMSDEASGIAIDATGNIWVPNIGYSSVTEVNSAGMRIGNPTGFQNAGVDNPRGIAIDGAGNVWVANEGPDYAFGAPSGSLSEYSSTGSPITIDGGYLGGGQPGLFYGMAVDGSGNIWISNNAGYVTEYMGAAAPVVTPIVANLLPPYGQHAVNEP